MNDSKPKAELEAAIEKIILEIKIPEYYRRIEKNLKKRKIDDEFALKLGIIPDNYYSAKEKGDAENESGMTIGGVSGSIVG